MGTNLALGVGSGHDGNSGNYCDDNRVMHFDRSVFSRAAEKTHRILLHFGHGRGGANERKFERNFVSNLVDFSE